MLSGQFAKVAGYGTAQSLDQFPNQAQGDFPAIAENFEGGLAELRSLIIRIGNVADRLGGSLPECGDAAASGGKIPSVAVTHRFSDAVSNLHALNSELAGKLARLELLI